MDVGCSSRWVIIPTCVLFAGRTTASDRGGFVMLFTLFWYARMRARVYWHFSSVRCFICSVSQLFSLYLCTRGDSFFCWKAYLPPPVEHTCLSRVGTGMFALAVEVK